jgi:ribosomal protein L37AE/L43A
MGRKERCPKCGSKKIRITANQKECNVCKNTWAGKLGAKTSKKEKVRF